MFSPLVYTLLKVRVPPVLLNKYSILPVYSEYEVYMLELLCVPASERCREFDINTSEKLHQERDLAVYISRVSIE